MSVAVPSPTDDGDGGALFEIEDNTIGEAETATLLSARTPHTAGSP